MFIICTTLITATRYTTSATSILEYFYCANMTTSLPARRRSSSRRRACKLCTTLITATMSTKGTTNILLYFYGDNHE